MPGQLPAVIPAADTTTATHALETLATELTAHGWTARLHTPDGRLPSLYVQNPDAEKLSEHIYAGPTADGTWSYWWSWADTIAPTADLAGTATTIVRVLRAAAQPDPAAGPSR
jgi:hypothetical protein